MRTGRPRTANAERFPSGKLKPQTAKQIAAAQRAAQEAEMCIVLAQPHRRGNRSQLAESPFGRFCLDHKLDRELYDAGEDYGSLKRRWLSAWSAPLMDRLGGNGGDIEMAQVRKWGELIKAWELAMLDGGGFHGRLTIISLVMDSDGVRPRVYPSEAKAALNSLAKYQGRIK